MLTGTEVEGRAGPRSRARLSLQPHSGVGALSPRPSAARSDGHADRTAGQCGKQCGKADQKPGVCSQPLTTQKSRGG